MFYQLLKDFPNCVFSPIKVNYTRLTPKSIERNGVIGRTSVFEEFDSRSYLNSVNFDDFQISNIIAVGALDMLKPTYMSDTNTLDAIAQVDSVLKSNLPKDAA